MAVKNFSNYKDDDKSYVKLIQSKARGYDQVKVIFASYTKVSSLKESTPYRGNSKGIRSNIIDDSTCIRLLYLAQNVFDMRTAENIVTMKRNDVKTNSDCPVSTGVSIPKRSKQSHDSTYCGSCRNRLIVYLYSQHIDAVLLALRWEPQLGTNFTAFLPSSELYLLHWLDLQKERNSPLKSSSAVKSSCAHHYVLVGSTLPM